MPINLILNGTFSDSNNNSAANWSGVDVEFRPQSSYIGGGNGTNRVTEMDGRSGFTTVLEQSFSVTEPFSTNLTFDTALRTSAVNQGDGGTDGFDVEILDSAGNVIAFLAVRPVQDVLQPVSVPVTFSAAGTYTLRFTEVGDDDSLGAIIDNVSILVCFAAGTRIRTPRGQVCVEDLQTGDTVETLSGPQELLWIGRRHVTADELHKEPRFAPVRIMAGALGCGLPSRDLLVSRQHRMATQSPVAKRMFGAEQVLVSAIRLTALPGIDVVPDPEPVTYYHLLFAQHEIVFANDAPAESMLTGKEAIEALTDAARAEITTLFPDAPHMAMPAFCVPSGKRQHKFVARLAKHNYTLLHPQEALCTDSIIG